MLSRIAAGVLNYSVRHPDDPAAGEVLDLIADLNIQVVPEAAADDDNEPTTTFWWERN